jgi:signal transduction histidine kinase
MNNIKNCIQFILIINVVCAILFESISIFYKTNVILKPVYKIIDSLQNYKVRNHYENVKNIQFVEGQILNDSINKLVVTIQEREKEILQSNKLRAIGEMTSKIAHEIRNPISTIKSFFQVLMAKPGDINLLNKFTPIILSELDRMNRIAENLLDYSRVPVLNLGYLRLKNLIDEMLLIKSNSFKQNQIHIENHIENITVYTDREKLYQVLLNIISNAEEASNENGTIRLFTTINERNVLLRVIDDGCGMSKEVLKNIGTLFFTTKEHGNGLGIATSMKILEQLGGRLEFISEEGKGSEVTIEIPMHKDFFESFEIRT